MGYCIGQIETFFSIWAANVPKALAAIRALPAGKYAWVDDNFRSISSFESMMDEWRWEVEFDKDQNVVGIEFTGEKMGDDELLFAAIAPFVNPYCFIVMEDQDDHRVWRWVFANGMLYRQNAFPRTFGQMERIDPKG